MIFNNTSLTNDLDWIKRAKIINNVKRNKTTNNYLFLFISQTKFYKYHNYYYSFIIILSKNIIFNLNTLFRIHRKYLKFHHYYNSNIKKTNKKYNKKYLFLKNKLTKTFMIILEKDLKWKLIWYKWISFIRNWNRMDIIW